MPLVSCHRCADELGRWLAEATAQVTASARAGMAAAAAAGASERAALGSLADEMEAAVGGLAQDHDTFMRRHAIKVETQVRGLGAVSRGTELGFDYR